MGSDGRVWCNCRNVRRVHFLMMNRLSSVLALTLICTNALAKEKPVDPAPAAFFETTALRTMHLKVTGQGWEDMQPARPGMFSDLFSKPTAPPEDKKRSAFGLEYTYVRATVEEAGKTYADVGLRFKGNSSYTSAEKILKRPFKIDFNRYVEGQAFHGLTTLNLHNNALDPSFAREALSYELFREAGLPAPRTTFALVYLTVEGKYEKQLLGLYTVVEEVNKAFLKAHYGSAKGLLLKPENAQQWPYKGEKFAEYEKIYRPHTDATPETGARLIEFLKLLNQADDAGFAAAAGTYVDVPELARYVATHAIMCNMDSMLTTGHNFYMYVPPDGGRIRFAPWDMNLSLGAFTWVATDKQMINLSIKTPWVGPHKLLDRMAKVPGFNEELRKAFESLNRTAFEPGRMAKRIEAVKAVVRDAQRAAYPPGSTQPTTRPENTAAKPTMWLAAAPDLTEFAKARSAAVDAQLAGRQEGHVPSWARRGPLKPVEKPVAKPAAATKPAGK